MMVPAMGLRVAASSTTPRRDWARIASAPTMAKMSEARIRARNIPELTSRQKDSQDKRVVANTFGARPNTDVTNRCCPGVFLGYEGLLPGSFFVVPRAV